MKEEGKILIVDDDNYVGLSIRILLEQYYLEVTAINSPNQIPSALSEKTLDVIILDMNFTIGETSGKGGIHWLQEIKKLSPHTSIVLITAYGGIEIAVKAIKLGAFDYILKPWENEKLLSTVKAAKALAVSNREVEKLKSQNTVLKEVLNNPQLKMTGESPVMKVVFEKINKVAGTDANVLILGENGTGKELAAKAVHYASDRTDEIFINVDMGAIPDLLFESELFGHVKGAFTDAYQDRIGKIEAANKGTLFLDEITNLSLPSQAKLLKVLQERKVIPIGSNQVIDVDIRLICATNIDLYEAVKNGSFRQDLLYRINTVEIEIPPLRERKEDISLLAQDFLNTYKSKYKKLGLYVPDYVFKKLENHNWPGNVRELQHAIERAVIMSDGKQLHVQDFSLQVATPDTASTDDYNLEKLEKWAITKAIQKYHGNISHAAKELGLSRGAMYRRMEKYEL